MYKLARSLIFVMICFLCMVSSANSFAAVHTFTGTATGSVLAVESAKNTTIPFSEEFSFIVGDDRSFVFSLKGTTFSTDVKKNGSFSGSVSFDIVNGLCNVTVDVAGIINGKNASGTVTGSDNCGAIALTLNSTFTAISPTEPDYGDTNVVVIPSGDDFFVIPLIVTETPPPETSPGVVLEDSLLNGTTIGNRTGGAFGPKGWTHRTGEEKILWDLGANNTIEAGIIEFDITGIHNGTKGGWLQATKQRAYYFGFYNHTGVPIGNKIKGGNNPAFIEVRYNWGSSYACCSAIKFQAGDAGLAGISHEPFGTKPYKTWNANTVYKHKIVFGDGLTTLYINNVWQAKINYVNRPLRWRYLFLGDLNYPIGGPDNVTYSNVKITKTK